MPEFLLSHQTSVFCLIAILLGLDIVWKGNPFVSYPLFSRSPSHWMIFYQFIFSFSDSSVISILLIIQSCGDFYFRYFIFHYRIFIWLFFIVSIYLLTFPIFSLTVNRFSFMSLNIIAL